MSQKGNVDFCPSTRETWEERAKAKSGDCGGQTIVWLIARTGSGRDVWKKHWSKKVFVTKCNFEASFSKHIYTCVHVRMQKINKSSWKDYIFISYLFIQCVTELVCNKWWFLFDSLPSNANWRIRFLRNRFIITGYCPIFTNKGFVDWKACNFSIPTCPNRSYFSNEVYKCK